MQKSTMTKHMEKIECEYDSLANLTNLRYNGPGIAKEYYEKVFKVFQTIEARIREKSTGIVIDCT
jgi:light-regulated signal transduction histidine kinase (bacteriophytochrome)